MWSGEWLHVAGEAAKRAAQRVEHSRWPTAVNSGNVLVISPLVGGTSVPFGSGSYALRSREISVQGAADMTTSVRRPPRGPGRGRRPSSRRSSSLLGTRDLIRISRAAGLVDDWRRASDGSTPLSAPRPRPLRRRFGWRAGRVRQPDLVDDGPGPREQRSLA